MSKTTKILDDYAKFYLKVFFGLVTIYAIIALLVLVFVGVI